jgi:hypothetical protein
MGAAGCGRLFAECSSSGIMKPEPTAKPFHQQANPDISMESSSPIANPRFYQ